MQNYTIKEIAKIAGVSTATVSRVLNDPERVSEKLRVKVNQVIKETGFRPNSLARSLKVKKSNAIGVIVVNLNVPFFARIVNNLELALRKKGYIMVVACHHDQSDLEKQCLEAMIKMQVDAIIITSIGANEDYLFQVLNSGVPVLMLERYPRKHPIPSLRSDKKSGYYQLMKHLYDLGHRRFAMVTGDSKISSNHNRFLGIMSFIYDHTLPVNALNCYYGEFSEEYGYQVTKKILSLPPEERPTALLTGSSLIAIGVLKYCKEHGVEIPQQLSLTTLGNLSCPELITPTVTYMDDLRDEISQMAADKIFRILGEEEGGGEATTLPARIIVGDSTGIPPEKS